MPSADVIPISPGFIKAHSPLPPVNAYSKMVIGVWLFTFKEHKIFVLNIWLRIGNRCVRKC